MDRQHPEGAEKGQMDKKQPEGTKNNQMDREQPERAGKTRASTNKGEQAETSYLTTGEGPVNQILFTFRQPNKCPGRPSARLGQGQDHITEVNAEMCWVRSENRPEEGGLSTKLSAGWDRADGQGRNEQGADNPGSLAPPGVKAHSVMGLR